jgi:hypothetical protein
MDGGEAHSTQPKCRMIRNENEQGDGTSLRTMEVRFASGTNMWRVGKIVPILLFAPITLLGCLHAAASESAPCDGYLREKAPKFRLVRQIQNESMRFEVLFISVAPGDITQGKLLTLSCSLARTYAMKQTLVVWMLDNYGAAKRFNPQGEGNNSAIVSALRASYSFSRERNDQYVVA